MEARTANEERHQLVRVLFGEPLHLDTAGGVLAERAEVHLRRAVHKTGFVVGSDDEKGLLPAGVLFDPSSNVIDGLHELGGLFNNAGALIGVAGPVNGASLNHQECSARVVVKHVQCTQRQVREGGNVVARSLADSLVSTLAGAGVSSLLQGGGNLGNTPDALALVVPVSSGEFGEIVLLLDEGERGLSTAQGRPV